MKLKKKTAILSTFFLIKDLHPFFFEVVIDSIKNSKVSLVAKNKNLALFILYLTIFSTKNLNTQKNIKEGVDIQKTKVNFLYSITERKLMTEIGLHFNALNPGFNKNIFFDLYLSRDNEASTLNVLKSIKIIKNLNNI